MGFSLEYCLHGRNVGQLMGAIEGCLVQNRAEWQAKHEHTLRQFVRETAPCGQTWYSTGLNIKKSSTTQLVFRGAFRHEDRWTEHTITVKPNFGLGFTFKISGLNKNDVKDCLKEMFTNWLSSEVKGNVYVA